MADAIREILEVPSHGARCVVYAHLHAGPDSLALVVSTSPYTKKRSYTVCVERASSYAYARVQRMAAKFVGPYQPHRSY